MLSASEMRSLDLDPNMVDAALMTTRGVRRRLDLTREVPDQILLDCIDVAEQAPTGGNEGSRRWLVIKDQDVRNKLGQIYLDAGADWVIERAKAIEGTDHPNTKMMQGARHLAENITKVPALVIPTIIGRHDGSGRPGLFDSVIQSAWSFQVALRSRGLGTVWTSMILGKTDEIREVLGIPDNVTPVAFFPVAWTIGTEFSPSPRRYPAKEITYWDGWARTYDNDRDAGGIAAGPGVTVEADIRASPSKVWELVTDLNVPAEFSEEYQGGSWSDGVEPRVGATFVGRNENESMGAWETTSHVMAWDPPRHFRWHVVDPVNSAAQWEFKIEWVPGGSRLRFHCMLGPGSSGLTAVIDQNPDTDPEFIIAVRQAMLAESMQATVDGIRDHAQAEAA